LFLGAVSEWKEEIIEYYRAIPKDFHGSFHCDIRVEKFGYAYALNDVQPCHLSVDHVGLTLNDQPPTIEKHRKVTPFGAHLNPGCSILCAYLRNITEIRRVTRISPPFETYSHRETVAKSVVLMGKPLGSPCSPST